MKIDTVIIGGGITGLSTAYHLKNKNFLLLEKENSIGGICRSIKTENGFTYDYTGHLLHIKNDYVKNFIKKILRNNLKIKSRNSWIYSSGVFTRYPFQANLFGLPEKIIKECIEGLIEAKLCNPQSAIRNPQFSFHDWCLNTFGKGISKHFMIPYNEKLWKIDIKKLTTGWLGKYIPTPTLQEILRGAVSDSKRQFGYNATFYYPETGGIQSLIDAIKKNVSDIRIKTNTEIISIDTAKKIIKTNIGDIWYKNIVSTIPLPELIKLIRHPPRKTINAAAKLKWTSVLNINLGINRKNISEKHWIYFPEKKFVFYRVGFYSNFSKLLCPQGTSSMYIEISYQKIDKQKILRKIITDLKTAKILNHSDKIISRCVLDIPYAYVIYDKKRNSALNIIQGFLTKKSMFSIGRYGGWKYSTMVDGILDGRKVVKWLK